MPGLEGTEVEEVRQRIRARLALSFVLDDVDLPGRQKKLAAIVGAIEGPTKPLDEHAIQALRRAAETVTIPALVEHALALAGATTPGARRLVGAVAWLEGRKVAHPCDVLVTEVVAREDGIEPQAAIERVLEKDARVRWLVEGIERALAEDAARTEHATDAHGRLLYVDEVGRATTEASRRVLRKSPDGQPLFVPPVRLSASALTEAELWQWHFSAVPHGDARLREWIANEVNRAHDRERRRPLERPAEREPEVVASRVADLADVLADAERERDRLLEVPSLRGHEPLFVAAHAALAIADLVRGAVARLGAAIGQLIDRASALSATIGQIVPAGTAAFPTTNTLPTEAWEALFRLTGAPLSVRVRSAKIFLEALAGGLAPAGSELEWPRASIRDPLLAALAESYVGTNVARHPDLPARTLLAVLEIIAIGERTHRRASSSLASLTVVQRREEAPDDEAVRNARAEASRLADDLVARSVAEITPPRLYALVAPTVPIVLAGRADIEPPALVRRSVDQCRGMLAAVVPKDPARPFAVVALHDGQQGSLVEAASVWWEAAETLATQRSTSLHARPKGPGRPEAPGVYWLARHADGRYRLGNLLAATELRGVDVLVLAPKRIDAERAASEARDVLHARDLRIVALGGRAPVLITP